MSDLNVNPDTVRRLAQLAREFHAQEEVVIPEDPVNPSGDWGQQILASHADDASVAEFKSIVDDLEPDQQVEVVGLMWIGRGDFTLEEWEDVLAEARDQWTPETASYLIGHPMLADYLESGLELHGYIEE